MIFLKTAQINFLGVIESPTSDDGVLYRVNATYITNLFNRSLILKNANIIKEQGIEDFIANIINCEFINSEDSLLNINFLDVEVKTHTKKNFTVDTENGIYNFHTFITNCTQKYNIVYTFSIQNKRLKMTIKNIDNNNIELIDTNISDIRDYFETFKTNVVAKVTVICDDQQVSYYLLNDRTTTTDKNNENRAYGEVRVVYERNKDNMREAALNVFKSNSYSHLIQFKINSNSTLCDVKNWKIGLRVKIKNREGEIVDTYISAISIARGDFMYSIKTGNIRINFLDKLKKEKYKEG